MFRNVSPLQLTIAAVLAVLAVVPSIMILRRLGYSGWWAILAAISPINIIGLWILALIRWPIERQTSNP